MHATDPIRPFWTTWLPLAIALALPAIAIAVPAFYNRFIDSEWGIIEFIQVLFPLIGFIICLMLLVKPAARAYWQHALFLTVMGLGCLYLAGEEASWGQHWFGWATPEEWAAHNRQNETNLHNSSVWANRVPRIVLIVAIVLGGTVLQMDRVRSAILRAMPWAERLYPPATLFGLALIVLGYEVYAQIADVFSLHRVFEFHDGEAQETFIVWAVLIYAITLRRRFNALV